MIVDRIENAGRYAPLHPHFMQAFDFLRDAAGKEPVRYDLLGEQLYVMISQQQGKPEADAFLEAHRKYIDIHFCIHGVERIGWKHLSTCTTVDKQYDAENDFMTFADRPKDWVSLSQGMIAIFFPEDAHAPLVSDGTIHKAVVKVAV